MLFSVAGNLAPAWHHRLKTLNAGARVYCQPSHSLSLSSHANPEIFLANLGVFGLFSMVTGSLIALF